MGEKRLYKSWNQLQCCRGKYFSKKPKLFRMGRKWDLQNFKNFSEVQKKNWDHSYYFCINLILISLPHAFGKKLFKNYQNFSEKSPKFQKLFRNQCYSFLWNIYPCYELPKSRSCTSMMADLPQNINRVSQFIPWRSYQFSPKLMYLWIL